RGRPLALIAGPCVIESAESAMEHARQIKKIAGRLDIPFIFKSSYDKANRSSLNSFRGPGAEKGLEILRDIREELKVPVLSDVHRISEVERAAEVLDVIQIPAFLCRQTDLLLKAAATGKAVNVKKGQFMSPWEMDNVVAKIESAGNRNILLTERGTTFGYNTLVNDFRAIVIMGETGYPVVYDATHSVQMPGGKGASSGGESKYIPPLSKAAVAAGCDALFIEVHRQPHKALSDGPNMLRLSDLADLLSQVKQIEKAVGQR
ncbi:MAG: 3-deoxy-8-phosphooctulonate synthase, partial [Candidatus Makaraimicrobium thalassicum]